MYIAPCALFGQTCLDHGGVQLAWHHGVDPDAVRGVLYCHDFGELDDPRLGGGIGDDIRAQLQRALRPGVPAGPDQLQWRLRQREGRQWQLRRLRDDPGFVTRAKALGENLRREDGVRTACEALEEVLVQSTGGTPRGK